jgi:bacillopeptidase F
VSVDAFAVGTGTTQDSSTRISYDRWIGYVRALASGGSYRASTAGQVSLTFTGNAVDWVTALGPKFGTAKVYIDGVDRGTFDLYSKATTWQAVKSFADLGSGTHSIVIVPLGSKSKVSRGKTVVVDALVTHQ